MGKLQDDETENNFSPNKGGPNDIERAPVSESNVEGPSESEAGLVDQMANGDETTDSGRTPVVESEGAVGYTEEGRDGGSEEYDPE